MPPPSFPGGNRNSTDAATYSYNPTALSDTVDLPYMGRALWVGAAGNLQVLLVDDDAPSLLKGVQAGSLLPLRVKRIYATNTTIAAADMAVLS